MIHFTANGIFADTEEEKLEFYDLMLRGDPVILGHVLLHEMKLKALGEEPNEKEGVK